MGGTYILERLFLSWASVNRLRGGFYFFCGLFFEFQFPITEKIKAKFETHA